MSFIFFYHNGTVYFESHSDSRSQAALEAPQENSDALQMAQLKTELDAANQKLHELNYSSHFWWTQAQELNQTLSNLHYSRSWKIISLVRTTAWKLVRVSTLPKRVLKRCLLRLGKKILRQSPETFLSAAPPASSLTPRAASLFMALKKHSKQDY